jgi:hypothetical protein
MMKLKHISIFSLISATLLFLLIMPAFAKDNDTCTVSSDGTQVCVVLDPAGTSGSGSSPGYPGTGTIDPGIVIPIPTPGIPMEKTLPEGTLPVEMKPFEPAPDAIVPDETITPAPLEEMPGIAEDSITKDDNLQFITTSNPQLASAAVVDYTGSIIGWSGGFTLIASFIATAVYALRTKKNQK